MLKILSSHEWVTLGIALFTTQSWAITSVSGKAQLIRPVCIHLLNELHQVWNLHKFVSNHSVPLSI